MYSDSASHSTRQQGAWPPCVSCPVVLGCMAAHTTPPLGVRTHRRSTGTMPGCSSTPHPCFPQCQGAWLRTPSSSCHHNAQLHLDPSMCVHPWGVGAHVFILPLGAGMCVHVCTTPRCQGTCTDTSIEFWGADIYMPVCLMCEGSGVCTHLLGCEGAHTHTYTALCISGIGSRHTCSLGAGRHRSGQTGMGLHTFFLPFL